jgi:aspartyl-tRNA(Asn)/glutamyl-tRNA(Gln) amidotransferase subunit A
MGKWKDEYFGETAVELNRRLAAREFSAVDAARAFCGRLEKLGPRYEALSLSLRDEAVQQAKDADRLFKRGRNRGPLQGVPCGVSDLLSVAGRPATWGSALFAGQVFREDASAVERLRKAGALITGKLRCCELGGAGMPPDWLGDATGGGLNPHDPSRWTGGPGGAACAAVAAGLVTVSIGVDTCGSFLRPAGYCGVTALRPTFGTASRFGAMPLAWTVDAMAIAARTAEDCGHALAAISGTDLRDAGSPGRRFYYAPQYSQPVEKLRAGYIPGEFSTAARPTQRPVLRAALEALRAAGPQVVEFPAPELPCEEAIEVIVAAESASAFSDLIEDGRAARLGDPRQSAGLRAGAELKAAAYLHAARVRRLAQEWLSRQMESVDLLISPLSFASAPALAGSTAGTPPPLPKLLAAGILAGLPMLTLPAGEVEGLPAGVLLAARPRMENVLLKTAAAIQARDPAVVKRLKY